MKRLWLLVCTLLLVVVLAYAGATYLRPRGGDSGRSAGAPGKSGNPQTPVGGLMAADNGEGAVNVTAILLAPKYLKEIGDSGAIGSDGRVAGKLLELYKDRRPVVVWVAMNTHEVDLSGFDPAKSARLTGSSGVKLDTIKWYEVANQSHHRRGLLVFDGSKSQGSPALGLILKDLAGVPERSYRWKVPADAWSE